MRQILHRGTIFGCALTLVTCAAGWLASAAYASDSIYWTSYMNSGAIRLGDLGGSGAHDLLTGESSPEGVAIDPAAGTIYWPAWRNDWSKRPRVVGLSRLRGFLTFA